MGTTTSSNFYKEFGGRLSLTERSNRSGVKIPLLVDTCILYLNRGFLKTPNLFNVPASRYLIRKSDEKEKLLLNDHEYVFRKKSIKLYMRLINAGRIKAVPFRSIKDPHILSGLLKSYFALLNPSLFTYFLYDNTPFELTNITIHTPSLHTLDNNKSDVEICMVHKLSSTANSKINGIILSRFFEKGPNFGSAETFMNQIKS